VIKFPNNFQTFAKKLVYLEIVRESKRNEKTSTTQCCKGFGKSGKKQTIRYDETF